VDNKTVVVDRDSAVLGFTHEGNMPLQANHYQLCKFSSPQDPNYVIVRNVLAAIVADEMRAIDEAPISSLEINLFRQRQQP
jgi:hypothetical protein